MQLAVLGTAPDRFGRISGDNEDDSNAVRQHLATFDASIESK